LPARFVDVKESDATLAYPQCVGPPQLVAAPCIMNFIDKFVRLAEVRVAVLTSLSTLQAPQAAINSIMAELDCVEIYVPSFVPVLSGVLAPPLLACLALLLGGQFLTWCFTSCPVAVLILSTTHKLSDSMPTVAILSSMIARL